MQVAIDNAKRQFDINLTKEIKRIKEDMDISQHNYPEFWKSIKRNFKGTINKELHCPMNYLSNIKFEKYTNSNETLPMSHFFRKFELDLNRKTCRRVESFIEKYSLDLFDYNISDNSNNEEYFVLRSDFDDMISEIRGINISSNYLGLMSWLIDRAFTITPDAKRHKNETKSTISKNKSLLLKVLYDINSKNLLKCFSKNV